MLHFYKLIVGDNVIYQVVDDAIKPATASQWMNEQALGLFLEASDINPSTVGFTDITLDDLADSKLEHQRLLDSDNPNDLMLAQELGLIKAEAEQGYWYYPMQLLGGLVEHTGNILSATSDVVTSTTGAVVSGTSSLYSSTTDTLSSGATTVYDTVAHINKRVNNSGLGLVDTLRLATSMLTDGRKRSALMALGHEYRNYKASLTIGQKSHHYQAETWQKNLLYLHQKGSKRTITETEQYHALLQRQEDKSNQQIKTEYETASFLVGTFEADLGMKKYPLENDKANRSKVQQQLTAMLCRKFNLREDELTLDHYSAIELAASKVLLRHNNALLVDAGQTKNIGILIPVHKEHNRLKRPSECISGEDFLYQKLRQVEFLFEGTDAIDWHMTFVDDEPKEGNDNRTIDAIRRRLGKGGIESDDFDERVAKFADKVTCLDYDTDLRLEIKAYKDEKLSALEPDELASKSVKGAAVHLGLRYLSRACEGELERYRSPAADIIYSTDADLSINLAGIGLELHEMISGEKQIAVGSRRIENSHVYGRTKLRELQSYLFNQLVRASLNIQLSDTQVGAKAFSASLIRDIHHDFAEISMAFDPEIIRLMKEFSENGIDRKYHLEIDLAETGRVWRDSAMESQSAGQSMNMFAGLRAISERLVASGGKWKDLDERAQPEPTLDELYQSITEEGECFDALMALASDPRFQLLIEHFNELYLALAPKELRKLMNDSKRLFVALANNDEHSQELIKQLLEDVNILLENLEASDYLGFILQTFPESYALGELLQREPGYIKVILPLLLGHDNPLSTILARGEGSHASLKELGIANPLRGDDLKRMYPVFTIDSINNIIDAFELDVPTHAIVIDNNNDALVIEDGIVAGTEARERVFKNCERYGIGKAQNNNLTMVDVPITACNKLSSAIKTRLTHRHYVNMFTQWKESSAPTVKEKERVFKAMSPERLSQYQQQLEQINNALILNQQEALERLDAGDEGEARKQIIDETDLTIGIVLNYSMDGTSKAYVDKIIRQKAADLHEAYGRFKKIKFKFIVVDTRPEEQCTSGIDQYINNVLEEISNSGGNVSGVQIHRNLPAGKVLSKGEAVRAGMDYGLEQGCNQVGFVDFSDKIHIEEVGGTIIQLYYSGVRNLDAVAIGSRRLEEAEVENKPLIPLMQSTALNLFVKSMFPLLFPLSDTQTGFKFFSRGAWEQISAKSPSDTSMAFDVELLQIAAMLGMEIGEVPVDFFDSRQNEAELKTTQQTSIFQGLIDIRGRLDDASYRPIAKGEAVLLGAGAENMVFSLENGSIIKIPHEALGDDFFTILKNVIFKNRSTTDISEQASTLETASFLNQVMEQDVIKRNVAALRNWKELNAFVMRMISAVENKSYKAIGYEPSLALGKDLIVPFRMVDEPVRLKIFGVERFLPAQSGLKQSIVVKETFGARFYQYLEAGDIDSLNDLFDQGVNLFEALWRRGLFDLDTNFMRDTGYYPNSAGEVVLMCLDPGEIINDLSHLDVDAAVAKITERADYQEMKAAIETSSLPIIVQQEILSSYQEKIRKFFVDVVKVDAELINTNQQPNFFAKEQSRGADAFRIEFPDDLTIEVAEETQHDRRQREKIEAFRSSKMGYQKPFIATHIPDTPLVANENSQPFLHTIPYSETPKDYPLVANESRQACAVGSIVPLFDLVSDETPDIIVLDSGTATRSSLLKYATPDKAKGEAMVAATPLFAYAAKAGESIKHSLLDSPQASDSDGYVVLLSADDFLEPNGEVFAAINDYFYPANGASPAFYWTDLPNSGRDYFPMTKTDTFNYLMANKAEFKELLENFTRAVPFLKGFSEQAVVAMTLDVMFNSTDNFNKLSNEQQIRDFAGDDGNYQGALSELAPLMAPLMEYYKQYMIYHATKELGGPKTPFLMVFKQSAWLQLQEQLLPILREHSYIIDEVTWENLLIRGMKADELVWKTMGKPAQLPMSVWMKIYEVLQKFKSDWNIDVSDSKQNEARVFQGFWHNLDDPKAMLDFVVKRFSHLKTHTLSVPTASRKNNFEVIRDQPVGELSAVNFSSSMPGTLALVGSEQLLGKINITPANLSFIKPGARFENLFYNINLKAEQTLVVRPNHLTVSISGEIFSIPMGMMTKETLKQQTVIRYRLEDDTYVEDSYHQLSEMPEIVAEIEDMINAKKVSAAKQCGFGNASCSFFSPSLSKGRGGEPGAASTSNNKFTRGS